MGTAVGVMRSVRALVAPVRVILRAGMWVSLGVALPACNGPMTPDAAPVDRPDVRGWVVPELAASSLDAEGHFVFPDPPPSPDVLLTSRDAEALAVAFVKSFITNPNVMTLPSPGPGFEAVSERSAIEWEHGGPIDWDQVHPAPWPPYFMESPVAAPSDTLPQYFRNHLAPRWHVLFVAGSDVVMDVAVATTATDVTLGPGGFVASAGRGNDFHTWGFRSSPDSTLQLLPERATRAIAATGARVASLPRLMGPSHIFSPGFARWELRLDRSIVVTVDSSGESLSTDEVLIGPPIDVGGSAVQWYVRAPNQPASEAIPYAGPNGHIATADFPLAPGFPFDVVSVHPKVGGP